MRSVRGTAHCSVVCAFFPDLVNKRAKVNCSLPQHAVRHNPQHGCCAGRTLIQRELRAPKTNSHTRDEDFNSVLNRAQVRQVLQQHGCPHNRQKYQRASTHAAEQNRLRVPRSERSHAHTQRVGSFSRLGASRCRPSTGRDRRCRTRVGRTSADHHRSQGAVAEQKWRATPPERRRQRTAT